MYRECDTWLSVLIFQSGSTLIRWKDLSPLELCCQLNNLICFAILSPGRNVILHRSKVEMSWHVHAICVNEVIALRGHTHTHIVRLLGRWEMCGLCRDCGRSSMLRGYESESIKPPAQVWGFLSKQKTFDLGSPHQQPDNKSRIGTTSFHLPLDRQWLV